MSIVDCNFENISQETNKYFHCNIDGDDVQHQNEQEIDPNIDIYVYHNIQMMKFMFRTY